jgi:hypothetical protein
MRAIRLLRILYGASCLLFAMSAGTSFASIVLRTLGNDSIATAQNLDGYFSRDFNPDIGDMEQFHPFPPRVTSNNTSTTISHATVLVPVSSPRPTPSFDYYSFTVPAGTGLTILDVDYGGKGPGAGEPPFACPSYFPDCSGDGFDSVMFLFNASGGTVAFNDDADTANGAGGTFVSGDAFLQLFLIPGLYFIRIQEWPNVPLHAGETYALQVSVDGHAIPEPVPLLLIVLSIGILITLKARGAWIRR